MKLWNESRNKSRNNLKSLLTFKTHLFTKSKEYICMYYMYVDRQLLSLSLKEINVLGLRHFNSCHIFE